MIFFLAILFLCDTDGCQFYQAEQKFFKASECKKAVAMAVEEAKLKTPIAHGTCVAVNTKDLL